MDGDDRITLIGNEEILKWVDYARKSDLNHSKFVATAIENGRLVDCHFWKDTNGDVIITFRYPTGIVFKHNEISHKDP